MRECYKRMSFVASTKLIFYTARINKIQLHRRASTANSYVISHVVLRVVNSLVPQIYCNIFLTNSEPMLKISPWAILMMTSTSGNISRVTGNLWEEFIGPRWIFSQKGQWHGPLMFSLISVWINGWVNNREAGDVRRYRAHYGVTVMLWNCSQVFIIEDLW